MAKFLLRHVVSFAFDTYEEAKDALDHRDFYCLGRIVENFAEICFVGDLEDFKEVENGKKS